MMALVGLVVPFATPSVSSELAVVCHRIWEIGRKGCVHVLGEARALLNKGAILDLATIFRYLTDQLYRICTMEELRGWFRWRKI